MTETRPVQFRAYLVINILCELEWIYVIIKEKKENNLSLVAHENKSLGVISKRTLEML